MLGGMGSSHLVRVPFCKNHILECGEKVYNILPLLSYLVGTPNTIEGGIFFSLFNDLSFDADETFTSCVALN